MKLSPLGSLPHYPTFYSAPQPRQSTVALFYQSAPTSTGDSFTYHPGRRPHPQTDKSCFAAWITPDEHGSLTATATLTMEALFDAPSSSNACASVADLQEQLRTLLDSKVKPTKAEHVTVTFELRSNVTFAVPVTETEHASLEAGVSVDPRLAGGVRAGSTVMDIDGQIIRHINALDTVLGQSQDDPVPQRIVAKHIMAGVGDADLSQWVMRSMARGTQGWTFTYGCKNSAQTWARQHAKTPARTAIGEWSNKDGQDTVNLSKRC